MRCPSYQLTDLSDCMAICAPTGLDPYPWERTVLATWLAYHPGGRWACRWNGLSMPRQNGKTGGCVRPRAVLGMVKLAERVLYTAHLQKTNRETFEDFLETFESKALSRYVRKINTAIGREGIYLVNGGRIEFLARTDGGGRGHRCDLLVYDEAQELTDEQQASYSPTQKSSKNRQTLYVGTPAVEGHDGGVFRRLRGRALAEEPENYSWTEWGVTDWPDDICDQIIWLETNPSVGWLFPIDNLMADAEEMSEDKFVREDLGYWTPDEVDANSAIPIEAWKECDVEEAPEPGDSDRIAYGVKFAADGETYSVGAAVRGDDGTLVECVMHGSAKSGIAELAQWLYERRDRAALICIDGLTWAPTLYQRLLDLDFPKGELHRANSTDVSQACGMLAGAVKERTICHIPQPLLEESVKTSPRRAIGREGWGFDGPIPTPIESVALAYWAVMTTKRDPTREMLVCV